MYNNESITIFFEDGTQEDCELIALFAADNGIKYAAALPHTDLGGPADPPVISLLRDVVGDDEENSYTLFQIEDENEFGIAFEAFNRLDFVMPDVNSMPDVDDKKPDPADDSIFSDGIVISLKRGRAVCGLENN